MWHPSFRRGGWVSQRQTKASGGGGMDFAYVKTAGSDALGIVIWTTALSTYGRSVQSLCWQNAPFAGRRLE